MSIEITVYCNGCSAILAASRTSAADARRVVREEMGGKTNLPGGMDLCRECIAFGRQPE